MILTACSLQIWLWLCSMHCQIVHGQAQAGDACKYGFLCVCMCVYVWGWDGESGGGRGGMKVVIQRIITFQCK